MLGIYERILEGTSRRGLVAGVHCASAAYAARMIGKGFLLVTILSDSGLMLSAARAAVEKCRTEAGTIASRE
jgi:4-hydroxy-2-oxoheptanedioate aldolase